MMQPRLLSCAGVLCGMILLAFAGISVVVAPSAVLGGAEHLEAKVRHLQGFVPTGPQAATKVLGLPVVLPPTPPPTLMPIGPYVSITTTVSLTVLSLFDSSDSSSSGSSSEPFKSFESASSTSSGLAAEQFGSLWVAAGGTTIIQLCIMICFAVCYNMKAVQPVLDSRGTLRAMNIPDQGNDDFENGICECFGDKWVCFHSFCCPLVRMAHTNALAGVMGFWESVMVWCCCSFMSVGLGPCCLMVYWRMRLKDIMSIREHALNDLFVTFCCPFLSVCQQASAVDTKFGYQVVGCCDLEWAEEEQETLMSSHRAEEAEE